MKSIYLLIFLSIFGLIVSFYLIKSRTAKKKLVCLLNENCNKVTESKYNRILYVKNDFLGFIYYFFILIFGLYFIFFPGTIFLENLLFLIKIIAGIATLFSIILFFIQMNIIKSYCSYCLATSSVNIIIFLIVLFL